MIDYTKSICALPERHLLKLRCMMKMAIIASEMSTCSRRHVGCVVTDENLRILSIGFNGRKANVGHCIDSNPTGDKEFCNCIHAEQNANAFDAHPKMIDRIYFVTTFPCDSCMKLLAANNVVAIYYLTEYDYYETSAQIAADNSIVCHKLTIPEGE